MSESPDFWERLIAKMLANFWGRLIAIIFAIVFVVIAGYWVYRVAGLLVGENPNFGDWGIAIIGAFAVGYWVIRICNFFDRFLDR